MDENISEVMNKFSEILNNKENIPEDMKEMIKNLSHSNGDENSGNKISPEMISSFMNMLNKNSGENNSQNQKEDTTTEKSGNASSNPFGNIDMGTIMKMKSIMDKMNSKDDPRSNLLVSLKPYLNTNRKDKVEQYVQLFNMTKVIDSLGNNSGGKPK